MYLIPSSSQWLPCSRHYFSFLLVKLKKKDGQILILNFLRSRESVTRVFIKFQWETSHFSFKKKLIINVSESFQDIWRWKITALCCFPIISQAVKTKNWNVSSLLSKEFSSQSLVVSALLATFCPLQFCTLLGLIWR